MDLLSIKEKNVLMNEVENDGKTVHLYFSTKYKTFVSYGISAYIVNRVVHDVKTLYDENLQIPMVVVNELQVSMLRRGLESIMDIKDEYLQFEADKNYDDDGYDEWAGSLRSQHMGMHLHTSMVLVKPFSKWVCVCRSLREG